MIRIDIIDPSPIYVEGLVAVFRRAGMTPVAVPPSPDDLCSRRPDVLLLNPRSESSWSTEPASSPLAPILLLTEVKGEHAEIEYRHDAIRGTVNRDADESTMVTAVRQVATGGVYLAPEPNTPAPGPELSDLAKPLSPREVQVLRQIARGLTHGQIARRLEISQHTVDTYVKRIRSKLLLGNKAELTRAALLGAVGEPPLRPSSADQ